MTYAEAMRRFGSEQPDLRFGLEIVECKEFFASTHPGFQAPYVGAMVMPGGASEPCCVLIRWQEWARSSAGEGLADVLVGEERHAQRAGSQRTLLTPSGWAAR